MVSIRPPADSVSSALILVTRLAAVSLMEIFERPLVALAVLSSLSAAAITLVASAAATSVTVMSKLPLIRARASGLASRLAAEIDNCGLVLPTPVKVTPDSPLALASVWRALRFVTNSSGVAFTAKVRLDVLETAFKVAASEAGTSVTFSTKDDVIFCSSFTVGSALAGSDNTPDTSARLKLNTDALVSVSAIPVITPAVTMASKSARETFRLAAVSLIDTGEGATGGSAIRAAL